MRNLSNSRIYNAFALTARIDNVPLHPGCRCALPWAMCFCAYSACWSMFFCEQVVRVNQEQFHFGYNKLDTRFIIRTAT